MNKFTDRITKLNSLLCIGLDPEFEKIPLFLQTEREPLFVFLKEIIDATASYAAAFKPNIAFFERFGSSGILQFEKTIDYIKKQHPNIPIIGDIKRGDLANTSKEYAKYFFGQLNLDSVTLSPYMGLDSLEPFLEYKDRLIFLLCLTSNPGSKDLQRLPVGCESLYHKVADFSESIRYKNYFSSVGIVVGATHLDDLTEIRNRYKDLFLLIPGVGAQGAGLRETVIASGKNSLINSSRKIIFSSNDKDFAIQASESAKTIHLDFQELFIA